MFAFKESLLPVLCWCVLWASIFFGMWRKSFAAGMWFAWLLFFVMVLLVRRG